MKACSKCRRTKPLSEFHKSAQHKLGVRSDCKECVRKRVAKRWAAYAYGASDEFLWSLLEQQGGKCAGCGKSANVNLVPRMRWSRIGLCIDHDHETGAVRGLLCSGCNSALGMVSDDPTTLRNLAAYIDHSKI